MEMFDYLRVEYEVPDINPHIFRFTEWQTKDLENTLGVYTINKEGELLGYGGKYHYTGVLSFYGFKNDDCINGEWLEFWILFKDGNLVQISNRPIEQDENDADPAQAQAVSSKGA